METHLKRNKMKQTVVEWLVKELDSYLPTSIKDVQLMIEQAKEMEKQQMIDFANWIRKCKLKQRPYDFENIEELLKIYKEEKGL